jgi:phosphohistidine phosphatase
VFTILFRTAEGEGNGMKRLLIMRHATPGNKPPGTSDHDRPLHSNGEVEAKRIGRLIKDEGAKPDLIMSSTAERARRTAELVSESCGTDSPWLVPELYLAEPEEWLRQLGPLPDEYETVMLVGHNPGLESLLEALTGSEEPLYPATLVDLKIPIEGWSELSNAATGRLQQIWRAQELDR